MKRRGAVSIGDMLGLYVKMVKIDDRLLAVRIMEEWRGVLLAVVQEQTRAEMIARQTQGMYIKDKTLYVTMTSAGAMASLGEVRQSVLLAIRAKFNLTTEHLAAIFIN